MKLSYFFAVIAFATSAISVDAQVTNSTPINTIPEGITTFHIQGTALAQTTINYFSAPLSNDPVYTGAVASTSTVSASATDTVTVGDSPAPWTANQFANPDHVQPYFLKFLSGTQSGRTFVGEEQHDDVANVGYNRWNQRHGGVSYRHEFRRLARGHF